MAGTAERLAGQPAGARQVGAGAQPTCTPHLTWNPWAQVNVGEAPGQPGLTKAGISFPLFQVGAEGAVSGPAAIRPAPSSQPPDPRHDCRV